MNLLDAFNITRPLGLEMRECSNPCCKNLVRKMDTWDGKQFCSSNCELEHDRDYDMDVWDKPAKQRRSEAESD